MYRRMYANVCMPIGIIYTCLHAQRTVCACLFLCLFCVCFVCVCVCLCVSLSVLLPGFPTNLHFITTKWLIGQIRTIRWNVPPVRPTAFVSVIAASSSGSTNQPPYPILPSTSNLQQMLPADGLVSRMRCFASCRGGGRWWFQTASVKERVVKEIVDNGWWCEIDVATVGKRRVDICWWVRATTALEYIWNGWYPLVISNRSTF